MKESRIRSHFRKCRTEGNACREMILNDWKRARKAAEELWADVIKIIEQHRDFACKLTPAQIASRLIPLPGGFLATS